MLHGQVVEDSAFKTVKEQASGLATKTEKIRSGFSGISLEEEREEPAVVDRAVVDSLECPTECLPSANRLRIFGVIRCVLPALL